MTFTWSPGFPCTESSSPRVTRLAVPSYEQRATFGINPQVDSWNLSFPTLTAASRDEIYAYLEAKRGAVPFPWTTPFGDTATWVCPEFTTSLESCKFSSIRATFELQYVPGGPNIATPAVPNVAFSFVPDFTAELNYQGKAQVMKFGDGYGQRITMGLRAQAESWRLNFEQRSNAERDQIRAYLRGAKGSTAFYWTDPRSGVSGRYTCPEWSIDYVGYNNSTIQATFKRVFEP